MLDVNYWFVDFAGVFDCVVGTATESVFYVADENITIINNPLVALGDYMFVMAFFKVGIDILQPDPEMKL